MLNSSIRACGPVPSFQYSMSFENQSGIMDKFDVWIEQYMHLVNCTVDSAIETKPLKTS